MGAAIITFEDSGDKSVLVSIRYTGGKGFDKSSHAHQHAAIVMAAAEEFLERDGVAVEDVEVKSGDKAEIA